MVESEEHYLRVCTGVDYPLPENIETVGDVIGWLEELLIDLKTDDPKLEISEIVLRKDRIEITYKEGIPQ